MEKFVERFINMMSTDTIHKDDINNSFHDAIVKNYKTILSEQCALCGVKRHQFKLADMKPIVRADRTKPAPIYQDLTQLSYIVGDSLVDYAKRFSFFSLNINDELLTQSDISSDKYSGIFEYNYIMFIDGYYIEDVQVLTDDNNTTFVLNVSNSIGIPGNIYSDFIKNDATVTVYIVPNFNIVRKTLTKGALDRSKYLLNSTNLPNGIYSEDSLIFINEYNNVSGLKTLCNYTYNDTMSVKLDSDWITNRKLTRCHITILNIPMFKLIRTIEFTKDNQPYFNIPGTNALIPTTNMMLVPYSRTVSNELTNLSKCKVSLYYPNIYKFDYDDSNNWDSSVYLGYFYDKSELAVYDNKLKLFYKYIHDVIGAYTNDNISEYVKNFMPIDVKYYNDLYNDTIHAPYSFAFKVDKLNEYANLDPDILVNYLYTKLRGKMRHYVYMAKLNLSDRVRMDNSRERVPYNVDDQYADVFQEVSFNVPHYVFSLSKAIFGVDEEFRFYLDNIALTQNDYYIQDHVNWYHVYIPCDRVTTESVLEIEKFHKIEDTIIIDSTDTVSGVIDFKVPDNLDRIYMNMMHLYDADTLTYLTDSDYKIIIHDDVTGDDITLVHGSRASMKGSAKIVLLNQAYHGSRLSMYIKTYPSFVKYDDVEGGMCRFNDNINVSQNNIKIYKNGIFLSPLKFLRFGRMNRSKFNGEAAMYVDVSRTDDDILAFDVLPFKNRPELFIEGVFCTDRGFVDTGDSLSLPIDLKWYDVYVNGRKLNKSNIEIISPNKFFIKNIDSRKNLEIWIRGDAPQEFRFSNYDETINDIIWKHDDFIRDAIEDSQDIIDDTLDDIFEEFVVNIIDQYKDFVKYFLEYSFINPNKRQLSPEIEAWYPNLFNEHSIMYLDSNTYTDAEFKTFINSNERYDEMKNGQYRYGFTPMHIGSHEDALPGEYMCDPLTGLPGIKDSSDETILPGGSINRVVYHRNKFASELSDIGMSRADIYQLQFTENVTSKLVSPNTTILDESDIEITDGETPSRICLSIDMDILAADSQRVMGLVTCDPTVAIDCYYYVDGVKQTEHIETTLGNLSGYTITPYGEGNITGFNITNIYISENVNSAPSLDSVKMILHSILIAF